jgi:hypothetical protein
MARGSDPRSRQMRDRVAHLAARIIAEDGESDLGTAKRKAARQAGLTDARCLPTNAEVEAALETFQRLYHDDEQRDLLQTLRRQAAELMELFDRFDPHLVGSVLTGAVNRNTEITLHLYTDDEKAVLMYLFDRNIPYDAGEQRLLVGSTARAAPVFEFDHDGTGVRIVQLARSDLRYPVRSSAEGRPIERIRRPAVEQLVATGAAP